MTSIFISYSRKDSEFASKLVKDLESAGHNVWQDQSDIRGGDDWLASIDHALKDCDILMLILSPDSVASSYVRGEVSRAINLNKRIVPVLWRQVDDLPFHLSTFQQVDFRGAYPQAITKLLNELAIPLPLPQNPAPLIRPPLPTPSKETKLRTVGISLIVLSLVGVAMFVSPLRNKILGFNVTPTDVATQEKIIYPESTPASRATPTVIPPTATDTAPPPTVDTIATQAAHNAEIAKAVKETQEALPLPTPTEQPTPVQVVDPSSQILPTNPEAGTVWMEPKSHMNFVFVPAGEFRMGSSDQEIQKLEEQCGATSLDCNDAFTYEKLDFRTSTSSYWIGQTEITNAQYQKFIDDGGYTNANYWDVGWQWRLDNSVTQPGCWNKDYLQGDNKPVVCVSWYEARAFTKWLAAKSGLAIRLPTEAEWEKAARGTQGNIYPWGNDFMDGRANYCDSNCLEVWRRQGTDGYATTAPVGSFPLGASPYGAMDMAGNVSEWTSSAWGKMLGGGACEFDYGYPYTVDDRRELPEVQNCRITRGGSWWVASVNVHSARRGAYSPDVNWIEHVGFRVVISSNID